MVRTEDANAPLNEKEPVRQPFTSVTELAAAAAEAAKDLPEPKTVGEALEQLDAVRAAVATPPQDVGYSGPLPDMGEHAEHPELMAARQLPDYKAGGWVVTDLGLLGRVIGIQNLADGQYLELAIDEGEQRPVVKLFPVDRVRPATTAEVTTGAARTDMVDRAVDLIPEQPRSGAKKKGGGPGRPPCLSRS